LQASQDPLRGKTFCKVAKPRINTPKRNQNLKIKINLENENIFEFLYLRKT
jgi:hypothetical protein